MRKFILFTFLTLLLSCSSDPIVYTLTATADPAEGGQVVPEFMEYGEGDTAYVVATPSDEYVLERWSGDASGNANTLVITMDKNKDVTAHFVKKKYPLTIKIEGEGEVKQEVIKQGMARDYNSGTIVKLTAEPDGEWLFVRWRGDLTGNENPTQITIDGPKTVVAEFEKKKYPLTIEIVGEGQVAEKVIKPGAPNDYNSGTIVELEALSGQSWDFSEWQVDLTGSQNPKQITINSPKTVRAVFVESSPVYLDENGVTIKAHDWAEVGQEGAVNGVTYKIIDREMLDVMIENGEDVTKVCTTKIDDMSELISWRNIGIINSASFDQDISTWDLTNVNNMNSMFDRASSFNQDISNWNVGNVSDMERCFVDAISFNQPIGSWDVSQVTSMIAMFLNTASFDQDLGSWDVGNVTGMRQMFQLTPFNQDISKWDVSNVTTMSTMFYENIYFNQDISNWNVSEVTDFRMMFEGAKSFNQDISSWNVSKASYMSNMFESASSFNQDLSGWNVDKVRSCKEFRYNASNYQLRTPEFLWCDGDKRYKDPIFGTWTLISEEWIGSGSWPSGQARGCWKTGDEGYPDEFIFKRTNAIKKVWECYQDGKLANDLITYGPLDWLNLENTNFLNQYMDLKWDSSGEITINYNISGGILDVKYEDYGQRMKIKFDNNNILQTWTRTSYTDD